jgi:hypothetical protein
VAHMVVLVVIAAVLATVLAAYLDRSDGDIPIAWIGVVFLTASNLLNSIFALTQTSADEYAADERNRRDPAARASYAELWIVSFLVCLAFIGFVSFIFT